MQVVGYILVGAAAYLLGSVPTGFLVAKAKGVDIRAAGSGNIGATNVFRVLGKVPGIVVLAVDALKGFVACAVVGSLGFRWSGDDTDLGRELFPIVAGFAAVLGHNYTCWLRFQGGKGIATSAGVLLALFPKALLAVLGIWVVVFALGRYVSLASMAAAFCLPLFVSLFGYSKERFWVSVVLAILAIAKHHSNIKRLLAGTEHRFGAAKPDPARNAPPAS